MRDLVDWYKECLDRQEPSQPLLVEAQRSLIEMYETQMSGEDLQPEDGDESRAQLVVDSMKDGLELAIRTMAYAHRYEPGWDSRWG